MDGIIGSKPLTHLMSGRVEKLRYAKLFVHFLKPLISICLYVFMVYVHSLKHVLIFFNSIVQDNKEYAKLRKKGIHPDFEEKLDRMFKGTSATGLYAYIPGASLHLPESPKQGDNQQNLEESSDSDDTSHPAKRRK